MPNFSFNQFIERMLGLFEQLCNFVESAEKKSLKLEYILLNNNNKRTKLIEFEFVFGGIYKEIFSCR